MRAQIVDSKSQVSICFSLLLSVFTFTTSLASHGQTNPIVADCHSFEKRNLTHYVVYDPDGNGLWANQWVIFAYRTDKYQNITGQLDCLCKSENTWRYTYGHYCKDYYGSYPNRKLLFHNENLLPKAPREKAFK